MNQLKLMGEEQLLQDQWKKAIEKFITHYVWHSQDRRKVEGPMTGIIDRLEGRLHEMQERRRRLIKYLYKKEGKLDEFEEGFHQSINKKSTIIKKFSSIQLEDLLRTSTKNVAQEVVSSLIPPQGGLGVLAQVEKYCQANNISQVALVSQPSAQNINNRSEYDQISQSQPQSTQNRQIMAQHPSAALQGSSTHNSVGSKQRMKSATMNKRINRGFSRENDDQFEDGGQQQFIGGYGVGAGDMPPVNQYQNNMMQ